MRYVSWISNNWNWGTIGTWFIGIITVLVSILYTRKQRKEDKDLAFKKEAQMAHDVANEFMAKLSDGDEEADFACITRILKEFHCNSEKIKYLTSKDNYDALNIIKDAAISWKQSYLQVRAWEKRFNDSQENATFQGLNDSLTKRDQDWEYLWAVLDNFIGQEKEVSSQGFSSPEPPS